MKVTEFLGKKVLDKNALELGKVVDMEIDPLKGVIDSMIISKGELSLKQKTFLISVDNIESVGDYIIINIAEEEVEGVSEPEEEPLNIQPEKE